MTKRTGGLTLGEHRGTVTRMARLGRRSGPFAAVLGSALIAVAASPPPASAISPKQAAKAALSALAPQKQAGPVVVYRMPGKLGAGRSLLRDGLGDVPASRATGKSTSVTVPTLKKPVHLFWADLMPGARFEHPGRLVLIDDRSGRVTTSEATSWWPIVDGKNPPFIGRATVPKRLIAYSSLPKPSTAASAASPREGGPLLGADAFSKDCMFQMGLTRDPQFAKDFPAMRSALSPFGTRSFTTGVHKDRTGQDLVDPDGADMRTAIKSMPADCEDILIYISGHGSETGEPRVNVGHRFKGAGVDRQKDKTYKVISRYIYAQDLVGVLEDNPDRTFKIKIDACYAARFIPALDVPGHKNLLVVEASSSATEVSWSALGDSVRVKDGEIVKEGGTVFEREYGNPGRGEFTNGNLLAFQTFTSTQAEIDTARAKGGSLFARMLERAVALGKAADLAATSGLTHPEMVTNLPAGAVQPPAPFTLALETGYSHTAFDATHPSKVCGKITTSPAQPGATVHVVIKDDDGGGATIYEADVTLGADGIKTFEAGITHYGKYTMTVTAAGASGPVSGTADAHAPPPTGTCPA